MAAARPVVVAAAATPEVPVGVVVAVKVAGEARVRVEAKGVVVEVEDKAAATVVVLVVEAIGRFRTSDGRRVRPPDVFLARVSGLPCLIGRDPRPYSARRPNSVYIGGESIPNWRRS